MIKMIVNWQNSWNIFCLINPWAQLLFIAEKKFNLVFERLSYFPFLEPHSSNTRMLKQSVYGLNWIKGQGMIKKCSNQHFKGYNYNKKAFFLGPDKHPRALANLWLSLRSSHKFQSQASALPQLGLGFFDLAHFVRSTEKPRPSALGCLSGPRKNLLYPPYTCSKSYQKHLMRNF